MRARLAAYWGALLLLWSPGFLRAQSGEADSLVAFELQFELDEAALNKRGQQRLDSLIQALPRPALRQILIYGHTDTLADADYNIALSKRRVQSVLKHFIRQGFDPLQVSTDFFGESQPAYALNPDSLHLNRRVELLLVMDRALIPSPEKRLSDYQFSQGAKIRIPQLQFVGNQALPDWRSFPVLEELLLIMLRNPDLQIELQGHVCCSNDGELSVARARMVYQFLLENGIAKQRLSYRGFSNRQPLYAEVDESSRALNRRVEVLVRSNSDRREPAAELPSKVNFNCPVLNISFPERSARLTPSGDFMLGLIANMLKESEAFYYQFVVYDNIGNSGLTGQRAQSLQRSLRRKGVPMASYQVSAKKALPWMPQTDNLHAVMLEIRRL